MNKTDFLVGYGRLVARSWEDQTYIDRLVANPHVVLGEVGINVPSEATITIERMVPTQGSNPDAYADRWMEGEQTGNYTLLLPSQPDFNPEDVALSDELLSAVAGGTMSSSAAAACCCCCPCCCCGSGGNDGGIIAPADPTPIAPISPTKPSL